MWGALEVTKHALELFRQAGPAVGGQLIQISSFLALSPFPGLGIYGASKAGELARLEHPQESAPDADLSF